MPMTVPEVILLGKDTRYRHFTRGSHDLYAPETMLPNPPPQYVWCYCVSKEHGNTVYFHNEMSGRSLWVLPTLTADGTEVVSGADEVMRVIGSVESSAAKKERLLSITNGAGCEERAESRRAAMRQTVVKAVRQVTEKKKPIEEVRTTQSLPSFNVHNKKNNQDTAPVRERLALWRARRAQQEQQEQEQNDSDNERSLSVPMRSLSSQRVEGVSRTIYDYPPLDSSDAPIRNSTSELSNKISSMTLENNDEIDKDKRGKILSTRGKTLNISLQNQQDSVSLEREMYDEKRRLFMEVNEELRQEKEAALRKERDSLLHMYRLQEVQQREEEERTRLAIERKELEQKRLELEKRALERQRELLVKTEEEAIRRELTPMLDDFFKKKLRIVQHAQEESQRALNLEKVIAESLLGAVTTNNKTLPVEERCIDLRILEDVEEESQDNGVSNGEEKGQQEERQQQRCERIKYSPSLTYVGNVVTNGHGKTPSFLRRQGHGTYFYDAAQKFFFDGEWDDDKRNGNGVISLPHVMVEGTWHNDKLEGRATFQTKRLKGTAELRQGALEGNAVIELDCNSVFAGKFKKNASNVEAGAMTFSSGDHVEWMNDAEENNRQRAQLSQQKFSNGTGRCRIKFVNGDVYIGQVENYRPHGNGSYRFAAEGHEYVGEFQHGLLQGHGTYCFADGNVYIGQLYKGLFHGEGQYVQQDAYTYEGTWEYGTAHGKGKLTFANGDVWEGEFDHDRRLTGHYTASRLFQLQ